MRRTVCILGAWLLFLAPGLAQDDAEHLAELDWQIPITLTEPIRKEAQSLTLYVSADQGKTWRKQATAKPTDEFFAYKAPGDGTYWFSVSFVNKTGQSIPARDADLQPQLKIVVDMKKPDVKLAAQERQNDTVTVSWDVKDDHLELNSLTLQYKAKTESAWKAVALSPVASGKKQFSVGTAGPVDVRLSVKDKAGNTGEERIDIPAATLVTAMQPQNSPMGPQGSLTSSQGGAPSLPAPPNLGGGSSTPLIGGNTSPRPDTNSAPPLGTAGAPSLQSNPPSLPTNPLMNTNRPSTDGGFKPTPNFNTSTPPTNVGGGNASGYQNARTRSQHGPIQWTNSLHLDLDFNVKTGPSGIGVIELYYTMDAGKTWQLFDKREDAKSPFSIDVPSEGIYGFTMIVKNRVGLGRAAPQPGEAPDIRIGVDVTAPVCELITPVEAVPGRKDVVNIKWTAIDNNLTATPIRIDWAENATGPWHSVVDRATNNGTFLWRVPTQGLPPQVFLKLEVTDMAGNVGTFITREPVVVDLQEPEIQIKGLVTPKK